MPKPTKRLPVADQIRKGLEDAIAHTRGEITLKTTTIPLAPNPRPELPAPPPRPIVHWGIVPSAP